MGGRGVNPLKSMTRLVSHYQLGYWMEAASPSDWVLQKSDVVFTDREEAVAYAESVMDEHRIAGFLYDYYKVFEYLKEVV